MTERQLVPEVFRAAFEDSDVLDNFNNWSDDHIKRLVSDFLRHDQYDGDLEEQGPEPFNVLYRFREIAKESHRQGIFPEVVEYSDIFIKSKGEKVPMSWVRILREDPKKALKIIDISRQLTNLTFDIVKLGINKDEIEGFVKLEQNN